MARYKSLMYCICMYVSCIGNAGGREKHDIGPGIFVRLLSGKPGGCYQLPLYLVKQIVLHHQNYTQCCLSKMSFRQERTPAISKYVLDLSLAAVVEVETPLQSSSYYNLLRVGVKGNGILNSCKIYI